LEEIVSMNMLKGFIVFALVSLAVSGAAIAQQESGKVGSGPPEDIFLEVTLGADGGLALSQSEFHLAWGGYYRFNLECPAAGVENEAGISFWAEELWQNSHLRIVSVSDPRSGFQEVPEINFHTQGLQIRMIDCEGLGLAARFSFFPMRKGTYPFTVLNDTVDPQVEVTGSFIVE
jgi:hypothetical protein